MNISEEEQAMRIGTRIGREIILAFKEKFDEELPKWGPHAAWSIADSMITKKLDQMKQAELQVKREMGWGGSGRNLVIFAEVLNKTIDNMMQQFKHSYLEPIFNEAVARHQQEQQQQQARQQHEAMRREQERMYWTQWDAEQAEIARQAEMARQAQEIINARARQAEQERARQAEQERARQQHESASQAEQERARQQHERARQEYERQEQERARQEQERARQEYERPRPPTGAGDRRSILAEELRSYGITDKRSYNKWALRNHPDKSQAPGQEALFQKVTVLWKELDDINNPGFNFSMGRKTGRRGKSPKKSPRKTRKSPKKSPHKTRKSR
jgi:flagellar biosynthesis GTPase FlhF